MPPFSGFRLYNQDVPFSGEHLEFWLQFVAGFSPVIPDLTIQVQNEDGTVVRNSPLSTTLQGCTLMMATSQFCKVVLPLAPNVEYSNIIIYNPNPTATVDIAVDDIIIELFVFESSQDAASFSQNNGVGAVDEDGTVCNDYSGVGGLLRDQAKFKSPIYIGDSFAITQVRIFCKNRILVAGFIRNVDTGVSLVSCSLYQYNVLASFLSAACPVRQHDPQQHWRCPPVPGGP